MDENIDVSVLVLTYNHVNYINKALESILSQQHNLNIEVLIIDDASSDGTDRILYKYKEKYPDIIKLRCKKVNSSHPTYNLYQLCKYARGKYVAFLDGDDYWVDKCKLQKQYDFLENNSEFSAHAGNVCVVDEKGDSIEGKFVYEPSESGRYSLQDFKKLDMPAHVGGYFTRNVYRDNNISVLYKADKIMGDITLFMLSLIEGDIYQTKEILSAYRYVCKDGKNNYNSINKENKYKLYELLRYWTRLEKYIQENVDKHYKMYIIKDGIIKCATLYSEKAMFKLLRETHKAEYYLVYMLSRHIFVFDETRCKVLNGNSWRDFVKDKSRLIIFGAGDLCARYIDEYGWKNDIIFIVDNDKNKQNTSYKGYLIKSPDEILKCNKKCKILIANVKYEKQIGQQLEQFGIRKYYGLYSMQNDMLSCRLLRKLFYTR